MAVAVVTGRKTGIRGFGSPHRGPLEARDMATGRELWSEYWPGGRLRAVEVVPGQPGSGPVQAVKPDDYTDRVPAKATETLTARP